MAVLARAAATKRAAAAVARKAKAESGRVAANMAAAAEQQRQWALYRRYQDDGGVLEHQRSQYTATNWGMVTTWSCFTCKSTFDFCFCPCTTCGGFRKSCTHP